jgi:DNA mismatch repair protein MutL
VGHRFEIEADEERLLLERLDEYREINISVEQEREGVWFLNAVPESCTGMEAEIIDFLVTPHDSVSSIRTALYADIACKRAVKEGERLDETSAVELIRKSLALPEPRCPHGRPVWVRLSEAELYRLVGRS